MDVARLGDSVNLYNENVDTFLILCRFMKVVSRTLIRVLKGRPFSSLPVIYSDVFSSSVGSVQIESESVRGLSSPQIDLET